MGCHALLRGSSQPRGRTQVFLIAGGFFTVWATRVQQSKNKHPRKLRIPLGKFSKAQVSACNSGSLLKRAVQVRLAITASRGLKGRRALSWCEGQVEAFMWLVSQVSLKIIGSWNHLAVLQCHVENMLLSRRETNNKVFKKKYFSLYLL